MPVPPVMMTRMSYSLGYEEPTLLFRAAKPHEIIKKDFRDDAKSYAKSLLLSIQ
jgi:hypothetical protein